MYVQKYSRVFIYQFYHIYFNKLAVFYGSQNFSMSFRLFFFWLVLFRGVSGFSHSLAQLVLVFSDFGHKEIRTNECLRQCFPNLTICKFITLSDLKSCRYNLQK